MSSPSDSKLQEELAKLTPEQVEMFTRALELTLRKRKIMLLGYVLAIVALIGGMLASFAMYGRLPADTVRSWVFLLPIALAAVLMWGFGRLARMQKPMNPTKRSANNQ